MEDYENGHFHLLAPGEGLPEDRCLGDSEPNVGSEKDQDCTCQKREAPPKSEKLLICKPAGDQQENAAGEKEADGCSELREHAVPSALLRRCILNRQEHGASPFAAKAESLSEATQCEQQRGGKA